MNVKSPDRKPVESVVDETTFAGSKNDWLLFKIASWSTALCLGAAAASVASLYKKADGFAFRISTATFVAFAVGAVVGYLYWKIISRQETMKKSSLLKAGSILLVISGIGLFLYPMRFTASEKMKDAFIGLIAGACALTMVGMILLRIKRALDDDTTRGEVDQVPKT